MGRKGERMDGGARNWRQVKGREVVKGARIQQASCAPGDRGEGAPSNWTTRHQLGALSGDPDKGPGDQTSGVGPMSLGAQLHIKIKIKAICRTVEKFPFVAMDTEFSSEVARPIGDFRSTSDYQYQLLRCYVDLLKIMQLGLTFLDSAWRIAWMDLLQN